MSIERGYQEKNYSTSIFVNFIQDRKDKKNYKIIIYQTKACNNQGNITNPSAADGSNIVIRYSTPSAMIFHTERTEDKHILPIL